MIIRKKVFLVLWAMIRRLKASYCTQWARFLLWGHGAKVGSDLIVTGWIRIKVYGRIHVGDHVRINSGADVNIVGGDRKTNILVGPNGCLEIENGVGLSNSTIIAMQSVKLLSNTMIGGGCDIYDYDFHEIDPDERFEKTGNVGVKEVVIGPDAFVGSHCIILKGVRIGKGAVIGAGSLVTRNVPDYEMWAGRPAKFIRRIDRQR
jgi:acetyltransferase-like isoleucine patch superfamily enzyme